MAAIIADRVRDTSTTTGTGALTVSGTAPNGYRSFSNVCSVGDTLRVVIHNQSVPTEWEVCNATYSAANTLTRTTVESSSTGSAVNFSAGTKDVVHVFSAKQDGWVRERLTANRNMYVGYVVGAPTISTASPAVVSLNSHGLSVNDAVVFSVLKNTQTITMTEANPCVVTLNSHGFAAGRPIVFSSTGWLPNGVVAGTTYYVISTGLGTNSFQFSATVGGAAVSTATAVTNTFVNANSTVTVSATHNLAVGQTIQFSGTSVVNVSNATRYYVRSVPSGTTFTFSATSDGSAITPGAVTTQGTFVQNGTHFVSTVGSLPTGLTVGTTYYVISSGFGSNSFQISTTVGGSAVNTTASPTGTPIYSMRTGSDSNNGMANTRSGAFMTLQAAYDYAAANLDQANYTVTIYLSEGTHTTGLSINVPNCNGPLAIYGNSSLKSNCELSTGSDFCLVSYCDSVYTITLGTMTLTSTGSMIYTTSPNSSIYCNGIVFNASSGSNGMDSRGGLIFLNGTNDIVGAFYAFAFAIAGNLAMSVPTFNLINVPTWSSAFVYATSVSQVGSIAITIDGGGNGQRYMVNTQSNVATYGGGATAYPGTTAGTVDAATFAIYS